MSIEKKRLYGVRVQLEFAAAHHIRGYQGDCARPHGHNYKIVIEAVTEKLNEIGLAVDFKILKKLTKEIVERLDHFDLNQVEPFTKINPTAETLAKYFYDELESRLAGNPETANLQLRTVTIWENDRSAAWYGLANS